MKPVSAFLLTRALCLSAIIVMPKGDGQSCGQSSHLSLTGTLNNIHCASTPTSD